MGKAYMDPENTMRTAHEDDGEADAQAAAILARVEAAQHLPRPERVVVLEEAHQAFKKILGTDAG
jgi:hypothetical protein